MRITITTCLPCSEITSLLFTYVQKTKPIKNRIAQLFSRNLDSACSCDRVHPAVLFISLQTYDQFFRSCYTACFCHAISRNPFPRIPQLLTSVALWWAARSQAAKQRMELPLHWLMLPAHPHPLAVIRKEGWDFIRKSRVCWEAVTQPGWNSHLISTFQKHGVSGLFVPQEFNVSSGLWGKSSSSRHISSVQN